MKTMIALLIIYLLPACASLQDAGTARYKIAPFTGADGRLVCCSADIVNGKNIAHLTATFTTSASGTAFSISEDGVDAKTGQDAANSAVTAIAKTAVDAALIAGAVMAAPVVPAIIASGGAGAAVVGASAGIGLKNSIELSKP